MAPFKITPVFRDYIWGGTLLKTEYGKATTLPKVAESWELARDDCPILIKFIDARENLSVQVHPGDDYAWEHENQPGKTELWIVLHSEPGAYLYYGFNRETSKEEIRERIADGTLTDILRVLPVRRGDVVFVPAGTVHAIGAGIVLAEIQQRSDVTYRLYDFGRAGADGNPRPLHIEKALDVLRTVPQSPAAPGAAQPVQTADYQLATLARCEYFTVEQLTLSGQYRRDTGSFLSILCAEGDCTLESGGETLRVTKGDSVFVPEGADYVSLSGIGWFILSSV